MKRVAAAALAALAVGTAAQAEVTDVAAHGFRSSHTLQVAAPPKKVWDALLQPGRWWDPAHTYSGRAQNLTLEAKAGGCFCETLKDGYVRHMEVGHIRWPEQLTLTGALGPLAAEGVAGNMVFTVKPSGGGSVLTMSYAVGGWSAMPFDKLAPAVDGVLAIQMGRLKRHAETGRPDALK
ncbi:MAG TPA: SRPBCC family protein [Caulobacteraceae bacterium]|jgi:uncharacterized protein YndB with AHSA1/START domain